MRRLILGIVCIFLLVTSAHPQAPVTKLKVRVILVDKDLNQKPVPLFALSLQPVDTAGATVTMKTGLEGSAEAVLSSGKYKLTTPVPIEFQGKTYRWEMEITLSGAESQVDLTNDNAKVTPVVASPSGPPSDDLSAQFKHLRNSVATVYSEFGHGTGFLVDSSGLVMTNEHVVGKSEYLAVQFDEKRKVTATLLASDPQKDVAILWVNLSAYPEAVTAPLSKSDSGKAPAAEGERVFTIGSPLNQQKVLTTGVISRIDAKSIISDININPGNSGGPLFNAAGSVIGVTTYSQQANRGPGLSGIVRIEEATPLVEQARAKTAGAMPPSATLLPVEPLDPFPIDALRAMPPAEKVDRAPYMFSAGEFDVALFTPALEYRMYAERRRELEKEREKRNKKRGDSTGASESGADVKDWEASEHKPTISVRVVPHLKVKFWASMAAPNRQLKERFKTDFYRMRVLCGAQEIPPIYPAKFPLTGFNNAYVSVEDTSYMGVYYYLPDAIAPSCGQMTLEIYSDKNSQPTVKPLDAATIQAIWSDFEPYRKAQANPPAQAAPAKN
jgi:S1-C subfamily serine protease